MLKLISKRFLAAVIDNLVIVAYALMLAGITLLVFHFTGSEPDVTSPFKGQAVGFFTLTLPVLLFFYFMESKKGGTIGKLIMKLRVAQANSNKPKNVFLRNLLKFLPWEIAHAGFHWITFYIRQDTEPTIWVWCLLIIPQVIIVIYIISIIIFKGESSLYDKVGGTKILL